MPKKDRERSFDFLFRHPQTFERLSKIVIVVIGQAYGLSASEKGWNERTKHLEVNRLTCAFDFR